MKAGKAFGMGAALFVVVFAAVVAGLQAERWIRAQSEGRALSQAVAEPALAVQAPSALRPSFDFSAAASKLAPSVVSIDNLQQGQNFFGETFVQRAGSGSGVIISRDGFILTNNHVIADSTFLKVRLNNARTYDARVIGRDARSDLALLKIEAAGLTAATFGDSTKLRPGEWILAVGNPLGYDNTLSVGVVSNTGRTLEAGNTILVDAIQTDAAINQGNSGGALATASGELVGINTAIASIGGGSIGIGFAIPIHRARRIVEDFRQFGRARYGSMGLSLDPRDFLLSDPDVRDELRRMTSASSAPPEAGLLIRSVEASGPAARSGVKRWDVLTRLDGKDIRRSRDMQIVMLSKRPGDRVTARVWSAGQFREITLTLGELSPASRRSI